MQLFGTRGPCRTSPHADSATCHPRRTAMHSPDAFCMQRTTHVQCTTRRPKGFPYSSQQSVHNTQTRGPHRNGQHTAVSAQHADPRASPHRSAQTLGMQRSAHSSRCSTRRPGGLGAPVSTQRSAYRGSARTGDHVQREAALLGDGFPVLGGDHLLGEELRAHAHAVDAGLEPRR